MFNTGFFRNDVTVCNEANLNKILMDWGLFSEFPAVSADNKGQTALATDRGLIYYSDGTQWVQTAITPPDLTGSKPPLDMVMESNLLRP